MYQSRNANRTGLSAPYRSSMIFCGAAVETREVIEYERPAVDFDFKGRGAGGPTMSQVPGGDVVLRVADDRNVVEEGGRQVNPPLVGKQSIGNLVVTEPTQPIGPPVHEPGSLLGHAHGQKAKVVDPVSEAAVLVVEDRLKFAFGNGHVRSQQDAVAIEDAVQFLDGLRDDDVGVEIVDPLGAELARRCAGTRSP